MDTWKLEKIKAYFMLTNETVFWLEHVDAWFTLSFVKGPEIGKKVTIVLAIMAFANCTFFCLWTSV